MVVGTSVAQRQGARASGHNNEKSETREILLPLWAHGRHISSMEACGTVVRSSLEMSAVQSPCTVPVIGHSCRSACAAAQHMGSRA